MRIGFFTDGYLPTGHGFAASLESFRKGLEALGHTVWIFAPSAPGYRDAHARIERFPSFRITSKPPIRLAIPHHPALQRHIFPELDIIHTHSPGTLGLRGSALAKKKKLPHVYTSHADLINSSRYYFLHEPYLLPRAARTVTRWFAQKANCIIAPSPKIERELRAISVTKPIAVLPTGVDTTMFHATANKKARGRALYANLGIPLDHKVLLYAGRIRKEKNLRFLIRAYRNIIRRRQGVTLLFVGDGPEIRPLKALSHRLKLPTPLFTGFVPHGDMPDYYAAADLFLISSHTDTQAIVVLEALASSLPVVALHDGAFEGILRDGVNGFLVPEESEAAFAARVLKLLTDMPAHRRLSSDARTTAEQFTEGAQAAKLSEIYETLLDEQHLN